MPSKLPVKAKEKTPAGRVPSFAPDVAKAFGTAIRERRLERDIAQDAFAYAAGIDRSYYGKLERGERQPSLALLLRIADGLQLPGWELLREVESRLRVSRKTLRASVHERKSDKAS